MNTNPYMVERICEYCGTAFLKHSCYLKSDKTGRFCSIRCAAKARPFTASRIIVCPICEKEFRRSNCRIAATTVQYCSVTCQQEGRRREGGQERTCGHCGKPIHVKNASIKAGRGKYCSPACYNASRRKANAEKGPILTPYRVELVCMECEKTFIIGKAQVGKKGQGQFCSVVCRGRWQSKYARGANGHHWRGGKVQRMCLTCGKGFLALQGNIRRGWGKYCSPTCAHSDPKTHHAGPDHYNWKGGPQRYPRGWQEKLRDSIRQRDGYKCQWCGASQTARKHDVHHIDYDKKNLDPKNLITLCISCHTKTGFNRDYWRFILTLFVKGKPLTEVSA